MIESQDSTLFTIVEFVGKYELRVLEHFGFVNLLLLMCIRVTGAAQQKL